MDLLRNERAKNLVSRELMLRYVPTFRTYSRRVGGIANFHNRAIFLPVSLTTHKNQIERETAMRSVSKCNEPKRQVTPYHARSC